MSNENSQEYSTRQSNKYFQDFWPILAHTVQQTTTTTALQSEPQQDGEMSKKNKKKKKKKKSHGNRQRQRFRAKLKRQGINSDIITTMLSEYTHSPQSSDKLQQQQQEIQVIHETAQTKLDKRKRKSKLVGDDMTTSLSQMSLMQSMAKRSRTTLTTVNLTETITIPPKQMHKSQAKPTYLNVPDHIFRKMLCTAPIEDISESTMVQLFDTLEKLQYAREFARLIHTLFYLKMKEDFWQHYYQIATVTAIGSMNMLSREFFKENNLHRVQFVTQENLLRRHQVIIEQLKHAEEKLMEHKRLVIINNWLLDMDMLTKIISEFVRKSQRDLSTDFERRKLLLQFDADECRLVQTFYDLQPSPEQIVSAKSIWQATCDKQQHEHYYAILKQRIYTKRLPSLFNLIDDSIEKSTEKKLLKNPILTVDKRTTFMSQREKVISRFKYDLMIIDISILEEIIRTYAERISQEKKKLIDAVHGQVPLPKSLVNILNAIAARQSTIIKRAQLITQHKLSFFEQLAFLANGPKYIPVCQSRFSRLPLNTIIEQEYQRLIEVFRVSLHDNCMSTSDTRSTQFFIAIRDLLYQLYTAPLSRRLLTRARYDYQMVRSIRYVLKTENIVLQKTDKSKVLHLASATSYEQKALEYMQKTNAYKKIESGQNPCMNHLSQVLTLIDPLLKQKGAIDFQLWKQKMRPNANNIELAYLYFIPKPHKIGTPLRPIVSSMRAAATGVSHFLDQLLRPLFDRVARQTTFLNDIDFIRQMELYRDRGQLSTSTTFVTFDVTDLYTMIPRNGALLALEQFLCQHSTNAGRINGMTIDTLMKMARLVLDTNCFAFQNQYYQQVRGGAMGSPFTMTLANIYMLKWEQPLVEHQQAHNELYGRYIDDVFMTTNLSLDKMNCLLDEANHRDPNIRITYSIGSVVEFLDVSIENNQGHLKTTVFHKPAAEPYIAPFLSDHPRHIHRNIIKGALCRVVRLCSDVQDFDKERLNIELTLLLNGYPPRFVAYHFKRFFEQNNVIALMEQQQQQQLNKDMYREFHHQLLHRSTRREKKHQQNQMTYLQHSQQPWNKNEIHVTYTFESGPILHFKRELKRLWKQYYIYDGSPVKNVLLKIGTRTNKSLSQLLIRQKPPKSILTNVSSTNTH